MRVAIYVLVVLCWLGSALAQPKKTPTKAQVDELAALDKQLIQHQTKQAYVQAAKVARKLYELQKKATGPDSLEAERRAQMLAGMLGVAGDYVEAHKLHTELLKATEKRHGRDSREVLYALQPVTSLYWQQGRYAELEPIYQRMLAISKKLDGEQSLAYAQQLNMYGVVLQTRNEYSSAQRIYEQSLKIQEALAKSKDDPALVAPLQMLANLLFMSNQQARAVALFDRIIAITTKNPNANVLMRASTLYGIAAQYHYGGRDDLAGPLTRKVIAMYDKEIAHLEANNPDDWQLVGMVGQLAFIYRQNGDLANAEKTFVKAIALGTKRSGFSGYEASLAEIKRAQGKHKEALALLEKVAATYAKLSPQAATVYNPMIADVLREMGDYKRAEAVLDKHRVYLAKMFGKKHPVYGMSQLSAAYVYMASGKIALAEKTLAESLDLAEKELALVLSTGTEADHAVYFGRNNYQLDTAINFHVTYAPKSPSAARLALTTLLRRKGRILDAAAASLATIRSKLSPADKKLLDDLAAARAKLAKLTVAGPSATGDSDYAKEVAALEDQIQKLELAVGKKSAAYRATSQSIELSAIQKLIPKDAKLVEIVNYQPGDPKAPYQINPKLPPRKMGAFVVGPKGDPVFVDLGLVAPIDEAVEKFRKAIADPDNDRAPELGNALYKLTMAKIIPKLGGTTNVLIAPDGRLNIVPFAALVDDKREFLIKKYTFTYLTSGRDLLRLTVKTKAQGGGVIFANPAFDVTTAAPVKDDAATSETRGRRSADLASLAWPPLPGTGQEADAVEKSFRNWKSFRGEAATEAMVKAVHGPRILHLATHGFFLPDEAPAAQAADSAATPRAPGVGAPSTPQPSNYENPLLRSGLALAGANKLSSGDEDGILTAMEASGLDLWGTKLVVLSACETGIGKVSNGEGVYGLRRALVIAGAESLVMTLWQVDDAATKELMTGYYGKLAAGKSRSSALRDVQLEIAAKSKYAHPYYWASFVPAGDNSPLKD